LTNLIKINCCINRLVSLPVTWTRLINLRTIYYNNNPIEYIPPNIQRIINRQLMGQNIYNDAQNVHNHNIQTSIYKSIE
jgi:Leucine-rich repeat (LRR) protein